MAGPFAEPKDIPETVMQASAAATQVLSLLREARGTLITPKVYPPEREVKAEDPRIGVFVCHCGTNIAGVVNVPDVVEYAKTLPNVVYAENNLYTCSNDTQDRIKEKIVEHNLNRVVVASCTPRTHESLFRNTWPKPDSIPTCLRWPISATSAPGCTCTSQRGPPRNPKIWSVWRWPRLG